MRSGKIPLALAGMEKAKLTSFRLMHTCICISAYYRLSDGLLDGKGIANYAYDLSRGDLSRPACSHVKQVAKQAGDVWSRPVEFFQAGFFVAAAMRRDHVHEPDCSLPSRNPSRPRRHAALAVRRDL